MFKKNLISTAILVAIGSTGISQTVYAAESDKDVEVIEVKGIRGSLVKSTAMKRDANGVVDAISAEDIGKFPDTNLAESLQRITGVSIDRSNGEGSKVTVRGFGPDYNMVTLNGRTMPASSLPAGGGTPNSRAFDFANLASDAISSVEVYKTGRANIATGGIGASININTNRPLDNPGTKVSVGGKLLHDTTNRTGDDITPELSGIFSWTDDDEMIGVSLTASHQVRHSGSSGGFVNQWNTRVFDPIVGFGNEASDISVTNGPVAGQLYSLPSDLRYTIADRERSRTNMQATFQIRPVEDVEVTLDYTTAKQDLYERRAEVSTWFAFPRTDLRFDNEAVKTPIHYEEAHGDGGVRDLGLAQQLGNIDNKDESLGLNVEWLVNDELTLVLDVHESTSNSNPGAPYGSWLNAGIGANVATVQTIDFSKELPIMGLTFDDTIATGLNGNGVLDPTDIGSQILDANFSSQESSVQQTRLDGTYELADGSIDFGIESRSMESHSLQSLTRNTMGNWGVENPGDIPSDFYTPIDFVGAFTDYNTTGAFSQAFTADAAMIGNAMGERYGFNFAADGAFATNRVIAEDIFSAYIQGTIKGELSGLPYSLTAGVRYEETEVTSSANIDLPNAIAWEGNNDFNVRYGTDKENFSLASSYDHVLPNLDFDIDVTNEIKARFSYSTTIARTTYNNLSSAATVNGPGTPKLIGSGANATASAGNPALVPLESTNLDLSVEWYFTDASYVSLGYYDKAVENFIGIQPVDQNFYGLRDATAGPRALAAVSALEGLGLPITDSNLFQMVAATENNVAFDSMTYEQFEAAYDVLPNSDDPLMEFTAQTPVNAKKANIDGFEVAVQHFFGETGFGFQANYTTVSGDVNYDVTADPSVTQFALVGLSDTANVIFMYENEDFQARIAYNWRDEFLNNAARHENDPAFTEAYSQIDFNLAYNVNEQLSVFFEGINITEENSRQHGRTDVQLWNVDQFGARYAAGARYNF